MLLVIAATVLLGGGYLYGRASVAPQVASSNVSKGVVEQEFDRLHTLCKQGDEKACAYLNAVR